jgi:hypothetical protein
VPAVFLALVNTSGALAAASGGHPAITPKTQNRVLRAAQGVARKAGDGHPYDIRATRMTYRQGQVMLGGSMSSHPRLSESVYLIAMRGRFNPSAGFVANKYAKRVPEVIELLVAARSFQQSEEDTGTHLPYPMLPNAVRLP